MADVEVKDKKNISKILIIVLLIVMMLMMATTLFIVVMQSRSDESEGLKIGSFFQPDTGEYTVPLEEFIVNLQQDGNAKHYVKITLALMYYDEDSGPTIESNVSKIRDSIISTLRAKTYDDVLDNSKTAGIKSELIENINTTLGDTVVKGVYITDVIVQ
ncbi:MAG: flagellar basal body-associated FliL family protein [Tissierellia bacterium]|nr:flagellar basal body-associated FliL family protein [Tissierellia bacterium]MDD4726411.1 flagellar basal body-associated FliL family protein [Tissierellia bacterium]